ncbi:hypothetical protein GZ142_10360, partial [Staphylococcus aureus]|nr:hypothetical protein [Staphylococcus aureus]NDQ08808.1 hypothetical protein [Staphylococcus aureus]NDQ33416.1 hypothetical protein [Staphylococcus aureus]
MHQSISSLSCFGLSYPNLHKYKNFHNQPQNSQHRNITKCYNKSITQRDKLLIQRRRNHMSITEKQRQQQ